MSRAFCVQEGAALRETNRSLQPNAKAVLRTFWLLLLLATIGAFVCLWTDRGEVESGLQDGGPIAPAEPEFLLTAVGAEESEAPPRLLSEPMEASSRTSVDETEPILVVRGTVHSKVTKSPLAAWVDLGDRRYVSSPESGRFSIHWRTSEASELIVEAPDHATRRIPLEPSDSLDGVLDLEGVVLTPDHEFVVEVLDGAVPCGSATVVAIVPSGSGAWSEEPIGQTREDGRLRIAPGAAKFLYARLGPRASRILSIERSAREAVLELISEPRTLRLEHDGRPGDRLALTPLRPGLDITLQRQWTAAGWTPPALPPEPYALRSDSPFLSIEGCVPGTFQRSTSGDRWGIDLLENREVRVHAARVPRLGVRLLDEAGTTPMDSGMVWLQGDFGAGWVTIGSTGGSVPTEDGWVHPAFLARTRVQVSARYRLGAWAIGREVRSLTLDPSPAGSGWAPDVFPVEMRLGPAGVPLQVRVLDADGVRYRHRVRVLVDGLPSPVHDGPADAGDVAVPRPESGAVRIETSAYARGFKALVTAEDLPAEMGEPLVLRIPTGSIRCESSGSDSPWQWICADGEGNVYSGWREGNDWVFRGLPEGEYLVGPDWVTQVAGMAGAQGSSVEWTTVVDGHETRTSAPAGPGRAIQGSLRTRGIDPGELWLRPLFGSAMLPVSVGGTADAVRVSSSGDYALPALPQGLPTRLLAFAYDDQGDEVALAAFTPGTSPVVECGTLEIEVRGLPEGREFLAAWTPEFTGGRSVVQLRYAGRVGETLTIRNVPPATRRVQIMSEGIFDIADIEIEPEKVTTLRLNY